MADCASLQSATPAIILIRCDVDDLPVMARRAKFSLVVAMADDAVQKKSRAGRAEFEVICPAG
jgi:hypothetical protein